MHAFSDSGAINDIYKSHHWVKTAEEAVGAALKAGCDINSGGVYSDHLLKALEQGAVNETTVDAALERAFQVRMRLGLFDPPNALPADKALWGTGWVRVVHVGGIGCPCGGTHVKDTKECAG